MKETEGETGMMAQPGVMSTEQTTELDYIHDVKDLVDAFAANARWMKALKRFHKQLLMRWLATVFHFHVGRDHVNDGFLIEYTIVFPPFHHSQVN